MNWYLEALKKYAVFSGRARRKEYWMFVLFNVIFTILAAVLDYVLKTSGIIYMIYILAVLIPSISITVRRLHDIGKSGFWYFICFIPIVGDIWLLVLLCTAGQSGENDYGEEPKVISI